MSEQNLLQARVLLGGLIEGRAVQPNDLVIGEPDLVKSYDKKGWLDSSASAVKYCESLGAKPIELFDTPEAVDVTDEMIVEAIKTLDKSVKANWTKSGLPQIEAIANIVGGTVKAADRDAAWRIVQEEETSAK